MATKFYYDWNIDDYGRIWPGYVFRSTNKPYVKKDFDTDLSTAGINETALDVRWNDSEDGTENGTRIFAETLFMTETSIEESLTSNIPMLANLGVISNGEIYEDAIDWRNLPAGDLGLFDVSGKQIRGKSSAGVILDTQYCNIVNLVYNEENGWCFVHGTTYCPLCLYDGTWLKDIGISSVVTEILQDDLIYFVVPTCYVQEIQLATYDRVLSYKKSDVLNPDDSNDYVIAHVVLHKNSIMRIKTDSITSDHINIYSENSNGIITSIDFEKSYIIAGSGTIYIETKEENYASSDTSGEENLDKALEDESEVWRTPSEYYGSDGSLSQNIVISEDGFVKADDEDESNTVPTWFWVNSLANWCTFMHTGFQRIELFVWNGKNGWDRFSNIMKPEQASLISAKYFYDVSKFVQGTSISAIIHHQRMPYAYRSLRLRYDTKFSQYDEQSFQTVRIGKVHLNKDSTDRYPFSVGVPPIMRLPSGEITLLYYLLLPGMTKKREVVSKDNIDFINSVCKAYFGDGSEKTIAADWKRFTKVKISGEETMTTIVNEDTSTLVNALEINTAVDSQETLSITFTIPRQYPETIDAENDSYVEDWG